MATLIARAVNRKQLIVFRFEDKKLTGVALASRLKPLVVKTLFSGKNSFSRENVKLKHFDKQQPLEGLLASRELFIQVNASTLEVVDAATQRAFNQLLDSI